MSARMGIFQETLYHRFGKHSKEALFYNVSHRVYSVASTGQMELLREALPLPGLGTGPKDHAQHGWSSEECALIQMCEPGFLG